MTPGLDMNGKWIFFKILFFREVSIWEIIRQQQIDIRMLKVQDFTDTAETAVS